MAMMSYGYLLGQQVIYKSSTQGQAVSFAMMHALPSALFCHSGVCVCEWLCMIDDRCCVPFWRFVGRSEADWRPNTTSISSNQCRPLPVVWIFFLYIFFLRFVAGNRLRFWWKTSKAFDLNVCFPEQPQCCFCSRFHDAAGEHCKSLPHCMSFMLYFKCTLRT